MAIISPWCSPVCATSGIKRLAASFLLLLAAGRLRAQSFPALAETVFSSAPFQNATVGAIFVSLDDGATFYSRNPLMPLIPASNAKLATTAAALERLKPDFRFKTSFLIDRDDVGKETLTALVWRGRGDPSISGRGRSSPCEIFELWAASMTAMGIHKVNKLVLDNRYFEDPAAEPSWPAQELSYWYAAPTSAISFNDNCVGLEFIPGARPGRRPKIVLTPDFKFIKVVNHAATAAAGSAFTMDYRRAPGTNAVNFFGSIAAAGPVRSDFVSVDQPAIFAASGLRHAWKSRGVKLGKAVAWEKARLSEDRLEELFLWESEPLAGIIRVVNKNSQNLYAEQLLKTLGKEAGGRGSFAAGSAVVGRFLAQAGLDESDHHLIDGSGLSEDNRLTASGIVRLLRFMRSSPLFPIYHESLAVPGVDKSVRNRMKGDALAGRMRVKPGTVAGARNLSGYLQSRSGKDYAFSVLVNGPGLDRRAVDEAVDRLCLAAAHQLP